MSNSKKPIVPMEIEYGNAKHPVLMLTHKKTKITVLECEEESTTTTTTKMPTTTTTPTKTTPCVVDMNKPVKVDVIKGKDNKGKDSKLVLQELSYMFAQHYIEGIKLSSKKDAHFLIPVAKFKKGVRIPSYFRIKFSFLPI